MKKLLYIAVLFFAISSCETENRSEIQSFETSNLELSEKGVNELPSEAVEILINEYGYDGKALAAIHCYYEWGLAFEVTIFEVLGTCFEYTTTNNGYSDLAVIGCGSVANRCANGVE